MSLLRLAEDLGIIKQGQVVIENLPYQQDIANMAGTSRETVSRMLTLLQRKGYIQKRGRRLTITNYDEFVKQFS
jgi:CRP-like cAMP-binding protein